MSDQCYSLIHYEGNCVKLCNILREKLEIIELKKVKNNRIVISSSMGSDEDIIFLKPYIESEGIKILEVNKSFIIILLVLTNYKRRIQKA